MSDAFYIASLKHTHGEHEHIAFWGIGHCGYTPVVGSRIGAYTLAEARELNDGFSCIAVPRAVVHGLLSPEPYFAANGKVQRFYDQRGPVVDNTKANWKALIAGSLAEGRIYVPKPQTLRRAKQSFSLDTVAEVSQ